ncbi:MAG: hemolysin III family protein [Rhodobacter sp.]|nr:hemolysin III family protein [Rhodobacter sp.]
MSLFRANRPHYSRAEYLSDAVIHVLGVLAALSAVPVLVTLAVIWRGDASAVLGITVYGVTLIAMLGCSAIYNMLPHPDWKWLLQRLDHSAIYLKIAGTYTPFALLSGTSVGTFLAGLWAAALAGTGLKLFDPNRFRWVAISLYLGMGWAGLFAGWALFAQMSEPVLALILVAGGLYTFGVVFYLTNRLVFHNTIWHVFVLAATVLIFAAVALHLADMSPGVASAPVAATQQG